MTVGLHHVAISVPDLDEAVDFYTRQLGLELVYRESWADSEIADRIVGLRGSAARAAILSFGNAFFEIFEYSAPAPRPQSLDRPVADHGIAHICIEVVDVWVEYERLVTAGMRFHCPPQDLGDGLTTYGRDPYGNVVELTEVRDPRFPSIRPGWSLAPLPDKRYDTAGGSTSR